MIIKITSYAGLSLYIPSPAEVQKHIGLFSEKRLILYLKTLGVKKMQQIYLESFFKDKKGFKKLLNYSSLIHHPQQKIIEERLRIIKFFETFGAQATRAAFGFARSTIYLWKQKLKKSGGKLSALAPASKAPKNRRKPTYPQEILDFIKKLRQQHPRIGKEKIKPFLDDFCQKTGIKTISESTIGRIIKRNNYFWQATRISSTGKIRFKRKKKLRRKGYQPQKPGDLVQCDGITLFLEGMKRYILTGVDLKSKFAFAFTYNSLSSAKAQDLLKKFEQVAPFPISRIQTDNGSEFEKYFDQYLKKKGITHFYIYPRRAKENGVVERFHRTLKEEFLTLKEDLLVDTEEFNRELMKWLIWYNCERPHKSLNRDSPMQFLRKNYLQSNMLWTYTESPA